jgi:hypothetical protein
MTYWPEFNSNFGAEMAGRVNLDAMIPPEDFEVKEEEGEPFEFNQLVEASRLLQFASTA